MKQVYLLTGRPGSGKTSLVKQVVAQMPGQAGGFYTEEIRGQGIREGFRLVTLNGETVILAHVKIHSPHRVGKYGVDIEALDQVGVPSLERAAQHGDLVVVDEIGKMELFSPRFREVVSQVVAGGKKVLGTIMLNPNPFADAVKHQPNVNLITVTRENYEKVLDELLRWVKDVPAT
jgi:nucleoside-triphosphatase